MFALAMLTAFLFYIVDAVTKMAADVKIVASYVKQQQQKKSGNIVSLPNVPSIPDDVSMSSQ